MAQIDMTKLPMENCPKFNGCNLDSCPLSPNPNQVNLSCDPAMIRHERCTDKRIRVKIGTAFNLPNRGLTGKEMAGQKRWESMPESEKQERIAKLQENSPISRLSAKGYMIAPKKKDNPTTHEQKTQDSPQASVENPISASSSQTKLGGQEDGDCRTT